MAAAAVNVPPPCLELANEELLRAHFRALWLAATRRQLPRPVKEAVDLSKSDYPVSPEIAKDLDTPEARAKTQVDCAAMWTTCWGMSSSWDNTPAGWPTGSYNEWPDPGGSPRF